MMERPLLTLKARLVNEHPYGTAHVSVEWGRGPTAIVKVGHQCQNKTVVCKHVQGSRGIEEERVDPVS